MRSVKLRLCLGGLQVNIAELKFLQALINGFGNVFDPIRDFGCDEELFTRDTTLLDGLADLGFIVVHLGTVKVAESSFQSVLGH